MNLQATKSLPPGYVSAGRLDLTKDKRALILLNVAGFVLLVLLGPLFFKVAMWLRPDVVLSDLGVTLVGLSDVLLALLAVVVLYAAVIVLHEGAHGIFFWWYSRSRPVFAFRGYYASAAAPGWFFPRNQYIMVGLAPLVLLTVIGFLILLFVPAGWFVALISFMALNASGAIGDLAVFFWLLRQPATCLAYDVGNAVTIYLPE
jgi:hypothetical protein